MTTQATTTTQRRTDPLGRESLFRQVGCLVGAVLLGYMSMATRQVAPGRTGGLLQASTLAGLTVAAIIFVPWDRLPSLVHRALPFVYLLVAVLARQATSGADSAFVAQLALLPVLWVAVYGTVLELGVTVTGATAALSIPLLSQGSTDQDWVRAIAIVSIGSCDGAMREALDGLKRKGLHLDYLRLRGFPGWFFTRTLANVPRVITRSLPRREP